jgi:hypothetical protein
LLRKWDLAQLPKNAQFIATFSKSFHFLRSDDYASKIPAIRVPELVLARRRTYVPLVAECIYVAGYASNSQYYTGLKDQREPVEQRSTTSIRGADLTALRTPLPQATLSIYVESIRSMPTPYGLVSTSQNLVEHHLTLTQPNQVIWYSLEPKNVNDFMSFV